MPTDDPDADLDRLQALADVLVDQTAWLAPNWCRLAGLARRYAELAQARCDAGTPSPNEKGGRDEEEHIN